MKKSFKIALAVLASSTITLLPASPAWSLDAGVQSMRGTDAQAPDQAPEEKVQLGKRPGSQKPVARTFEQQPPVIPHATENFDEITLEENQCLTCHGPEKYKEKQAPLIGESHFRNLQTGEIMKQMSSARHNCVQCHVPQVDAPPLVENTFKAAMPVKTAPQGK